MKHFKFLALAFLTVFVSSCSSTEEDNESQTIGSKWVVEQITTTRTYQVPIYSGYGEYIGTEFKTETNTDTYEYDDQGRIVSTLSKYNDGLDESITKFEYLDNSIVITKGNDIVKLQTKNGLISEYFDLSYIYNSSNQLIRTLYEDSKRTFSWSDGLLVKITESDEDGDYWYTINYDSRLGISPSCAQFINAWLLADFLDVYEEMFISGCFGRVPAEPFSKREYKDGSNESYFYSNIDENGCPGTISYGDSEYKYELKWRRLD